MKRTVVGAALAALCLISAQPAPAQTASAPSAPAEVSAPAPGPRQLELSRQLIAATGMDSAMSGMMHNMMAQLAPTANQNLSPQAQEKAEIIVQAEDHMFDRLVPKIVEMMQTAYARTFNEKELADLVAFYRSPAGRATVAKTPELMKSVTGQILGLMPQARREMGEEICAKTTCTPGQKAAYFGAAPAGATSP